MASPRIFLAIIISLVIARPLELKIFEKEINTELSLMNREIYKSNQDSVNNYYDNLIAKEENRINEIQIPLAGLIYKRDSLRAEATAEADGTGGTLRRNAGPIYQIKKANADRVEAELDSIEAQILPIVTEGRNYQLQLRQEMVSQLANIQAPDYTGFAARLEALSRLTSRSSSIWLANIFIIILFIAIETAPVFVKLISQRGPYDYKLETIENEVELAWLAEKAKKQAKVRKAAKRLPQQEQEIIDQYLSSNLN